VKRSGRRRGHEGANKEEIGRGWKRKSVGGVVGGMTGGVNRLSALIFRRAEEDAGVCGPRLIGEARARGGARGGRWRLGWRGIAGRETRATGRCAGENCFDRVGRAWA
jgi:hypothetical protein